MRKPTWGIFPQPDIAVSKPPRQAPDTLVIPQGTRFAVTLDTPLSTRISKAGQIVNFRTTEAYPIYQDLVIPPDTIFSGKVIEAHKPGSFGKSGVLLVKVDHIELSNGASAGVTARLDSQDINAKGRLQSDNNRTADLTTLALWSLQGTLAGAQIRGAKGAAVGAGAGATVALIILMSRHGSDVYLEPGTPFSVELDHNVSLPGQAVVAVNPSGDSPAGTSGGTATNSATAASTDGAWPTDAKDPSIDQSRPKVKHRPKL